MNKVIITVPATSANLGVGFDACGLALSLYNQYEFCLSSINEVEGFDSLFDINNNLVLDSYLKTFSYFKEEAKPIKITQIYQDIPTTRGLGSSSACIVAGVLGASKFLNKKVSLNKLAELAVKLEGHPDNVIPCIYGGLVSSFSYQNKLYINKYKISSKLRFALFIPNFELSTKKAREVLPNNISLDLFKDNIAKAINLPLFYKKGNIRGLRAISNNAFHENYRYTLIEDGLKIKKEMPKNVALFISGAGSTLLAIYKGDYKCDITKLKLSKQWVYLPIELEHEKVKIEEF